jgi:hypothetical protein
MRTTIDKIKVGDKIQDTEPGKYGQFIERSVYSIRVTKAGRFVIKEQLSFKNANGEIEGPMIRPWNNSAVLGKTIINLK